MSDNPTGAFLAGLLMGFLVTGLAITIFVTNPMRLEAINRGFAEMKLMKPTDTEAVFTWKEPK